MDRGVLRRTITPTREHSSDSFFLVITLEYRVGEYVSSGSDLGPSNPSGSRTDPHGTPATDLESDSVK